VEFFLTLAVIAAASALLSAAISFPIFRLKKPYAKPVAVVLGLVLFVVFAIGGFIWLLAESARRGHPF
jgi:ABC-type branched-subunit amino acid transport system permease subunit